MPKNISRKNSLPIDDVKNLRQDNVSYLGVWDFEKITLNKKEVKNINIENSII